jgi:3-oxoadipate enol-lactonase
MTFARIGNLVLHHEIHGPERSDITLVFINSLGTDFRIWQQIVPVLAKDWRIVLFDKRGHGLSDGEAGDQSLDNYAQDVLGLLDHLKIAKIAIIGLSIGGMIAQRLAILAPHRVVSLILCDTALKIGTQDFWAERMAAIAAHGLDSIADSVLARWFASGFRENRADEFAGWRNMLVRTEPRFYLGACAAIRDADLSGDAAHIKARTLCIVGDEDQSTPPDLVRALAAAIPGATFASIESAGHLPCVEQPHALVRLIERHLKECEFG